MKIKQCSYVVDLTSLTKAKNPLKKYHKFNLFRTELGIVWEYCDVCNKTREALGIEKTIPGFVHSALDSIEPMPVGVTQDHARAVLEQSLKRAFDVENSAFIK